MSREGLDSMLAAIEHRGPDDSGVFADGSIALGARRLSIIDVPGGHQPIQNEDGTVTVVFNGEIYNYRSLRERLLRRGHRLSTESDTEVLVHLYEDYGTELVHAVEGMYAFALWDSTRRLLVLARDRFGEKPLYYVERDGELAFASELHALVAGGACSWELEPEALDDYFTFGYVAGPGSVVRGAARQLPPGRVLTWAPSTRPEIRAYWSPPEPTSSPDGSFDDALEAADELLDDSVRSRLVADVPVGVFLSGGVDSTLLAAYAVRHAHVLKTFTVTYDRGAVGEGEKARSAAQLVGAEHHEFVLTGDHVSERVPGYLAALDQPIADEAFVALRAVSEFARSEVKVAVGGEGADEVFGGYPRYRWLARSVAIERFAPTAVRRGAGRLAAALPGSAGRLERVLDPEPLAERHVDWVTLGRQALRATLYGPRLLDHVQRRTPNGRPPPGNGSVEGLLMRLDQEHWLPGDVLAKADRASMQASLELRTPYLQRELVELAATVPPKVHVGGGGKLILRRLLARALPQAAHRRAKTAFRTPTADWLRGPLASVLEQQLDGSRLYADGWFDRDAMRTLAREHWQGADRTAVLWPVFVLGTWLDAR